MKTFADFSADDPQIIQIHGSTSRFLSILSHTLVYTMINKSDFNNCLS